MKRERINAVISKLPQNFSIYGNLFAVTNRVQAAGDKYLDDITMRQQYLLICLALFDEYRPTLQELSAVFGSSYQNVKRMANQLEKDGLLEIKQDTIDKRKIRIVLHEDKFTELTDETEEASKNFMQDLFKGISEEDQTVLANALVQMRENLNDIDREFFYI